jgi:hypothetical protein
VLDLQAGKPFSICYGIGVVKHVCVLFLLFFKSVFRMVQPLQCGRRMRWERLVRRIELRLFCL